MISTKIFLKDMLSMKKVKNYVLFICIFAFIISNIFEDFLGVGFNEKFIPYFAALAILTSTAYTIYTYSLYEKVKNYISLPIKKTNFLLGFILSLIIVSFLERVSLLIILVYFSGINVLQNICLVSLISIFCILINVWMLIILNRKSKVQFIVVALVFASNMVVFGLNAAIWFKMLMILGSSFIVLASILSTDSIFIAIIRNNKYGFNKSKFNINYFLKVMISEKIYVINTALILGIIIFLVFIKVDNYIGWSLTWAVGAVNTPVLTMLSSDLSLRKHADMLSDKSNGVWNMYRKFLIGYFVFVNLFILILNTIFENNIVIYNVIAFIILCILESISAYVLEIKFPLLKWKTKQDLWKHPRKYVIPLIAFITMTIFSLILV